MATKPLDQWRLDDAVNAAKTSLPDDYRTCVRLIEDEDHWNNGVDWPGQRSGDPVTDGILSAKRRDMFIPDDQLSEGCDNRTNGLIGQEADIQLVPLTPQGKDGAPSEEQKTFAKNVLRSLSQFWNNKGFWSVQRNALNRLHYAKRTDVIAFVAEGNMPVNPDGTRALPNRDNLDDALALIELEAPPPDTAIRYIDPLTKRPVAIIVTAQDNSRQQAQVWSYNPESKLTEVRIFGAKEAPRDPSTGVTAPTLTLNTRGRLPVAEARGQRIVTKSARRLQTQLNLATTYTSSTIEFSGSRERYFENVEPPGIWLKTPPSNRKPLAVDDDSPGGPWYKHSVPWVIGADISNSIVGLRTRETRNDGTQVESYATPGVTALDPVDPAFTTNAAEAVSLKLYRRMKQGHLGLAKTGEASGTAYIQARAQHEADLKSVKGPVEGMVRDLLEYILALAGLIHPGSAGILDTYRIEVTLKISAGPVTADEARLAKEMRDARGISTREFMARIGVEDAQAMQDEINADPLMMAGYWAQIGSAIQTLVTQVPGMTASGAGALLKLPPDVLQILATGVAPGFEDTPAPVPDAPETRPPNRPRAVA
jgi:hypothetical protein